MKTVLVSAPYLVPHLDRFREEFERNGLDILVARVRERLEEEELLIYAGKVDGVVCGDDRFTPRVIRAFSPRLKVISKWGTGVDSIDAETCRSCGVHLFRTPNAFSEPVADTVYGYMLAFVRRQPWMDRDMKAGRWEKLPGRALNECTLGIIGVGDVGKAVARRARGFGLTLLGNDLKPISEDFVRESGIRMVDKDELFASADFISLNCDLNPTSFHLMNAERFAQMKPEAVLINTSRGPVVDENALVDALKTGRIAGAALDVFEQEPLAQEHPLLGMDRVLLAPHNSNSSPKAWEFVHRNTIRQLVQGLEQPIEGIKAP